MRSSEIREAFLSYFEKRGHARVKSGPLVPPNDPTLFFTNAGMVQFKDLFTGASIRPYSRACSSQKCMRVSGKHNDLENVGHTPRHHTFFEMLGNFSFADYFKEEAIAYAWEFLTKEMGLDRERMCVTVFKDDDEAAGLWRAHVPAGRIFHLGEEDNFWAMGDEGPCGPCSEILWDFGGGPIGAGDLSSDRFMEVWNLVFMQFNRGAGGAMAPLANPSIDTGMGLERLACVIQGKRSNWETDLFAPIIAKAAEATGVTVGASAEGDVALRAIGDHIRGSAFLIADGIFPSNEGRGYVLRRILRRAVRYGKMLGVAEPFLAGLVPVVVEEMGAAYPELAIHQSSIEKAIAAEEGRFHETLSRGLDLLSAEMGRAEAGGTIPGRVAFQLHDTFGFPLDLTELIAAERGFKVDEAGFKVEMERQREQARASWKGSGAEAAAGVYREIAAAGIECRFVGYAENSAEAKVLAIVKGGRRVREAKAGDEVAFVADVTPFYGESGGQVGDLGLALSEGVEVEVTDAKRPFPNLIVHAGRVMKGTLSEGAAVTLAIDAERRQEARCNHTATHLLHRALREVLGEHVKQAGSLVDPKRLRFDFSHFQALTAEEVKEVERRVNEAVRRNLPVITRELTYEEAVAQGALAFFGEKYGDRVRMIDISSLSRELCGGTHALATGEIGMFKIVAESSVAAGVRRIEAVTGRGASLYVEGLEQERAEIARALKASPAEIAARIQRLVDDAARLSRENAKLKAEAHGARASDLAGMERDVGGIKVLAARVAAHDRAALGAMAEGHRDRMGRAIVALAAEIEGKAAIAVAVSKELCPKLHAGKIVQDLSLAVGGKGGGRPDFAQGGGADASKIDEALAKIDQMIKGSA